MSIWVPKKANVDVKMLKSDAAEVNMYGEYHWIQ